MEDHLPEAGEPAPKDQGKQNPLNDGGEPLF